MFGWLRWFTRPTIVDIRRVRLEYDGVLYAYIDGTDGGSYSVVDKGLDSLELLDKLQDHRLAFNRFRLLLERVGETAGADLASILAVYAVIHEYWLSIGVEVDKWSRRVVDVDRLLADMLDIYYRKPGHVVRMFEEVSNCLLYNGLDARLAGVPAVCNRTFIPEWVLRYASVVVL